MMDDIQNKQSFLSSAILEKGYNPQEFMNFLIQKKGEDGTDLTNWTLLDLKIVVKEFVVVYKPQSISQEVYSEDNNNEEDELKDDIQYETKNSNNEIKEIVSDLPKDLPKQSMKDNLKEVDLEETIASKMSEQTDFSFNERIIVQISDPEKIEGGLFSKSYVSYQIRTLPFEFVTKKRYSDFLWLRDKLQSIYIGEIIPSIPKKNFGERFHEAFISKRMRTLEKFFEAILSDPLLRSSQIVFDFLSIENEASFQEKKALYNNILPPSKLAEIKSLTGTLNIGITKEKETYHKNIKENAINNFALLQKLSKNYKVLTTEMDIVSNRMIEISNIWKQLFDNSTKFFDNHKVTETYKLMMTVMERWAEATKQQSDIISIDVREYFKYIKNEFRSLKEEIAKLDLNKSTFTRTDEKLIWKKEDLYRRQDILKWDLSPGDLDNKKELIANKNLAFEKMIPKETESVLNLKKAYGFLLNKIIEEFERLRVLNGNRHKDYVRTFYRLHHNVITEYVKILSTIMNGYIDPNAVSKNILAKVEDHHTIENNNKE